jgi:ferric-dicitrate binding protein FerR (iron transport regulator)
MRGVLAFDGAPLAEVRVALARWFDVRLEFADASLASRRLTGTFTSASVAELLAAIGPALDVRYEIRGNRILLSPVPRGVDRPAPDDSR